MVTDNVSYTGNENRYAAWREVQKVMDVVFDLPLEDIKRWLIYVSGSYTGMRAINKRANLANAVLEGCIVNPMV